ncbi:hypothetical protein CSC02_1017 [Enterobacter hormaechei subsp. hoffmannii]|nr:hypothetical protein CSC02_1017 [Enterobacter hormaechei subsp. hoffmannii]
MPTKTTQKKPAAYGWLFVSEAWGNLSILQGNHHLMHD